MYKKITTVIALLAATTTTGAQETVTNKVYCNSTKIIFDTLRKDYREEPFIYGRTSTTENYIISFWINPTTSTWTIVASTKEKTCILAGGVDLQVIGDNNVSKSF